MQKRNFFYTSGICAVGLYAILIGAILLTFYEKHAQKLIPKIDTAYKDAISIDAILDAPQPKKSTPDPKIETAAHNENGVKKIFSEIPDFEKIHAQKIKEEEIAQKIAKRKKEAAEKAARELQEKRELQALLALKQSQEKLKDLQENLKNANENLQNLTNIDIKANVPDTDDGVYDEWVGKIYEILYKSWDFSFRDTAVLSTLVTIDPEGGFSYRVLKFSNFSVYNDKILAILERLRAQKFPPYPKNTSIDIEVNFKSQAQ